MNQFSLFATPEPSIEGIDKHAARRSYSADLVGESGRVRNPVRCNGDLWVGMQFQYFRGTARGWLYRLVPAAEFDGLTIPPNADRCHGKAVKHGGTAYVLTSPSFEFFMDAEECAAFDALERSQLAGGEDDEESLDLFGDEDDDAEADEEMGEGYALPVDLRVDDDVADELLEPCEACGVSLEDLDYHIVTACGRMCEACNEVHRTHCRKCHGVDVLLVAPEFHSLLSLAAVEEWENEQ